MTGIRTWIVLLAATSFLAGMAAGRLAARTEDRGRPLEAYATRLEAEFSLDPERTRLLRQLLGFYAEEVAAIEREHLASYQAARAGELAEKASLFSKWIRDKVLPEEQRARYDRLVAGLPENPATPDSATDRAK